MILITGDTHGTIDYDKIHILNTRKILTSNHYLIVACDFGAIWNANTLDRDLYPYEKLRFTVLFIDGNHENFDILNSYPVTKWNGGNVHIIRKNIIHLMRGQVFNIEGKTIFTFGGGTSFDKYRREEHISWWKEEIPSKEEINEGIINLSKYDNKVDFIITHSCDSNTLNNPSLFFYGNKCEAYEDNYALDNFENIVTYKKWFFGHYHVDAVISDNKVALYNDIRELD